jgi:hypothetical protein
MPRNIVGLLVPPALCPESLADATVGGIVCRCVASGEGAALGSQRCACIAPFWSFGACGIALCICSRNRRSRSWRRSTGAGSRARHHQCVRSRNRRRDRFARGDPAHEVQGYNFDRWCGHSEHRGERGTPDTRSGVTKDVSNTCVRSRWRGRACGRAAR